MLQVSESEEVRIQLFLPDGSGPPVDDEAKRLLLAKWRGELPEEKERELDSYIERFRSWRDADHEISIAEMTRRRELGIGELEDRIGDSVFDAPLPLEEEAKLCREYMRLTGCTAERVIVEFYEGTPASARASDILK